jgi:ABC-type tungstate transport system substrate-binding protein
VLAVDVFLTGLVGGAVLGLILSKVHDRYLRSRSLRTRGIVFGIILWILLSPNGFGSEFGLLYDTISVLIGLVAYLAYGVPLARFFPRFKRNITENRKDPVVS